MKQENPDKKRASAAPGASRLKLSLDAFQQRITVSTLVFFPWLRLPRGISHSNFDLLPYKRGEAPAGKKTELQSRIDGVLEPYKEHGERSITSATLLLVRGKEITSDLDNEDVNSIFTFSELLAIAGLSSRDFFGTGVSYCNRDLFRVIIQQFNSATSGVVTKTRRRDGFTTTLNVREAYKVHKQDYISSPFRVNLDEELLTALIAAMNSMPPDRWESIFEAIVNFNSSNTDSPYITIQAEVVAIVGAFERLFDVRAGRENDLATTFSDIISPHVSIPPAVCERLASVNLQERFRRATTLREIWIRDFYRLRSDLAHGRIELRYPATWNIHDHLLLASFIFPLALKKVLALYGHYTPSSQDDVFIEAFERLTCVEHCIQRDVGASWPWNDIIGEKMLSNTFRETFRDTKVAD